MAFVPAVHVIPNGLVYIARSTTISAAGAAPDGRLSMTTEKVVVRRVGKSDDTFTLRRLRGRTASVSAGCSLARK